VAVFDRSLVKRGKTFNIQLCNICGNNPVGSLSLKDIFMKMKAAVYDNYGDASVFRIAEVDRPKLKPNEALVEVKASSVNPVDWKIRRGNWKFFSGFGFPKISGSDFSGIVRASNIYHYKPGDEVFGMLNPVKGGAYAQYATVKAHQMNHKPATLNFNEAGVTALAGLTAFQIMKYKGKLKSGHNVLINACCGGVGHFAVQYCKSMGASVTGICSTEKIQTAYQLGANRVIDYKKQNIYEQEGAYDVILDPVRAISFEKIKSKIRKNGTMISFSPSPEHLFALVYTRFTSKNLKMYLTNTNSSDLGELKELIEAGKIRPLIHKVFPLEQISEAHKESENGHVAGKIAVVINLTDDR
jgi:NADPH:quinone reductase-like Zn-dependent oxidoreductase